MPLWGNIWIWMMSRDVKFFFKFFIKKSNFFFNFFFKILLFYRHNVLIHITLYVVTLQHEWHHMSFKQFFFSNFFACCDMPIHIMMYDKCFYKFSFIKIFFFNWTFFQYFFKSSHSSMHWNSEFFLQFKKKSNGTCPNRRKIPFSST